MIPAKLWSSDHIHKVEFDATDYFEQANLQDLIDLVECNFWGGYPTDTVALFFEEEDASIDELLEHCRTIRPGRPLVGFECAIDRDAALIWLEQNRPELFTELTEHIDW